MITIDKSRYRPTNYKVICNGRDLYFSIHRSRDFENRESHFNGKNTSKECHGA